MINLNSKPMSYALKFIRERGVAAIEAALVMPIVLLMIFGGIQVSAMYYDYLLVNSAATEAARQAVLASSTPLNSAGIASVALNYLTTSPVISFGSSNLPSVSVGYIPYTSSGSVITLGATTMKANAITTSTLATYASSAQAADICPATRVTPPNGTLALVTVSYSFQGPYQSVSWANKTLSSSIQFVCE